MTVRDQWLVTGWIYYTTPWFLLALFAGGGALLGHRLKWVLCMFVCLFIGWFSLSGPGGQAMDTDFHLRLWNAQNPVSGQQNILQELLQDSPDVIVGTDSGPLATWIRSREISPLPADYQLVTPGGGFLFLIKEPYELETVQLMRLPYPHTRFALGTLRISASEQIQLVAVEMDYDPKRPKADLYPVVKEALHTIDAPRILAGDFNMPPGSVWLQRLKRLGFRSAFREAGQGLEVSWPEPVPFLGIDQVWGEAPVYFTEARYGEAVNSDHRKLDVFWRLQPESEHLRLNSQAK